MGLMDLSEREAAESLLGLSGSYTIEDIDAAYRDFARANHPDRASDPAERRIRTERMSAANRYKGELAMMFASRPAGYSVPSVADVEEDAEAEEAVSRWWDGGAGGSEEDARTVPHDSGVYGQGAEQGGTSERHRADIPDTAGCHGTGVPDGATAYGEADATEVMPSRQGTDGTVPMPRPVGYAFPDAPYAGGQAWGASDGHGFASPRRAEEAGASDGPTARRTRKARLPLPGVLAGWASASDAERRLMADALADRTFGTSLSRVVLRVMLGIAMGMAASGIFGSDGAASLVPLLVGCGEVLVGLVSKMVIGIIRKTVRFAVPFAGELLDGGRFLAKVCGNAGK